MKSEYIKVPIKNIEGCTFIEPKDTSGFFIKETRFHRYIQFSDLYRGHNYYSKKFDDDYHNQEQFFALADFLNDRLYCFDYYKSNINNQIFSVLLQASYGLTPEKLERKGYFYPEFYKSHLSNPRDIGIYKNNGICYEVTNIVFSGKTGFMDFGKRVNIYCKNNVYFTIEVTKTDFDFFMSYIQLSLLVHLKEYVGKNSITIINEDPIKCLNKAITMGLIK